MGLVRLYYNFLGSFIKYSSDSITLKKYNHRGDGEYEGGQYVAVSDVKAKHHGMKPEEMVGLTDFDLPLFSRKEAEDSLRYDLEVLRSKKPYYIEEQNFFREGRNVFYNTTITPLINFDTEERISMGVICQAHDISQAVEERRRAIEERLRAERLIRFLSKRTKGPLIAMGPEINKLMLDPEYAKLASKLNEMLLRSNKLLNAVK